jgi:hypothetical protein
MRAVARKLRHLPQITTAPAIGSVTPSQGLAWPPNHQMVPLFLTVNVTDVATAAPMCAITGITSNEPVNAKGGRRRRMFPFLLLVT